jgi:hypothetical protein
VSGPPYPRPAPGAPFGGAPIGQFQIGVSPIGTVPFSFDVWQTVISQYANASILSQLCTRFSDWIDPTANLDAFFDLVWNVDSAQGHGLDVWGRIVGVVRTITIPQPGSTLGFDEAGSWVGFGQGTFFAGAQASPNFALSDAAFRLLIFAKALSNISDGSIPSINQILLNLFPGRGNCYVADGLDMSMTYTFAFKLTAVELAVLQQSGALPKPVGVSATIVQPP